MYFSSPPDPFGSSGQSCRIDPDRTVFIPDYIDDELAVTLGISGLAAWLPLTHHASVAHGEAVLVLGATGVVGHVAVQAAKVLGRGSRRRGPDAIPMRSRVEAVMTHVNDRHRSLDLGPA